MVEQIAVVPIVRGQRIALAPVPLDVRLEDGALVIHRRRGEPVSLSHRTELTFAGAFPFAEIEFLRSSNGEITGLLAGNGRTKGVRFTRQ